MKRLLCRSIILSSKQKVKSDLLPEQHFQYSLKNVLITNFCLQRRYFETYQSDVIWSFMVSLSLWVFTSQLFSKTRTNNDLSLLDVYDYISNSLMFWYTNIRSTSRKIKFTYYNRHYYKHILSCECKKFVSDIWLQLIEFSIGIEMKIKHKLGYDTDLKSKTSFLWKVQEKVIQYKTKTKKKCKHKIAYPTNW